MRTNLGQRAARMLKGLILACAAALSACANDPFNPWVGGPWPQPGAERYLDTRLDIADEDKTRFLDQQPIAPALLAELATSAWREVRALVAVNPATPPAVLNALAFDRETGVRQFATQNPRLPRTALLALLKDPREGIRLHALSSPAWSAEELAELYRQGYDAAWIANAPNASTQLLKTMARAPVINTSAGLLYMHLALHPHIDPELEAILLAVDQHETRADRDNVWHSLAINPRLSCPSLRRLAQDSSAYVARAAQLALEQRRKKAGRGCEGEGP